MVKVYFETNSPKYAELVATFDGEEIYHACLPALEEQCKKDNFDFVTESIEDDGEETNEKSCDCPKCSSNKTRAFDNQPLAITSKEQLAIEPTTPRYDNEIYLSFICDDCNHIFPLTGKITL